MRSWLSNSRDAFRTQLWPVPTIGVVLAVVLGVTVPKLDASVDDRLSGRASGWLFGGDADAARSLLDAIAASLITVTALTFSLTVVTLQLASSQFSPRLLRTFSRDRFVQATLALFLATFTFALTVLRAVRGTADGGGDELVPKIAVTFGFVLTVASVLGLVLFLAHLTQEIRVETMLRNVHRDAETTMRTALRPRDSTKDSRMAAPDPPPGALTLLAGDNGFLTWVDQPGLLTIAVDEEAVVCLDAHPGSLLVEGTPVGTAWSTQGGDLTGERAERIATAVAGCIHVGFERTSAEDVGFGLRQLTDVANKALSPGINDPTTATHALGHISAFLCALTGCDLGAELVSDDQGQVRVILRRPDLASYVDLGISQPRRYGAADPQVLQSISQLLLDLSHRVSPDQRPVVRNELARLRATIAAQPFDSTERGGLDSIGLRIESNLQGPAAR